MRTVSRLSRQNDASLLALTKIIPGQYLHSRALLLKTLKYFFFSLLLIGYPFRCYSRCTEADYLRIRNIISGMWYSLSVYLYLNRSFVYSLLAQSNNTPPKLLHNHCLQFLLGHDNVPREVQNNAYADVWGVKEVYYGICASSELTLTQACSWITILSYAL